MSDKTYCGGCHCGDVRYAVSGPSVWKAICYCESCTRSAGAPAMAWAGIEKLRFRLLKGTITIYESSPGVLRGFCRRCGTSLTYQKDPLAVAGARDDIYIATRSLDDPTSYPPDEHVYYGERVRWLSVTDELPHHETLSTGYSHLQLATMKR